MLSPLESKHIAEQSLSLQERLKRISQLDIKKAGEPSRASKDRRTKWLELAFRGNHISFQKRLEIAGLNDDDIDFVLTDNLGWLDETPKWLGTLNEILHGVAANYLKEVIFETGIAFTSSYLLTAFKGIYNGANWLFRGPFDHVIVAWRREVQRQSDMAISKVIQRERKEAVTVAHRLPLPRIGDGRVTIEERAAAVPPRGLHGHVAVLRRGLRVVVDVSVARA